MMLPFGGDRRSIRAGAFDIPGSFQVNAALAPLAVKGKLFTVARTGVGEYTITLKDRVPEIDTVSHAPQCAVAGTFTTELGAISLVNRTIVIRTLAAGVPADIAADANNRVNFNVAVGGP